VNLVDVTLSYCLRDKTVSKLLVQKLVGVAHKEFNPSQWKYVFYKLARWSPAPGHGDEVRE